MPGRQFSPLVNETLGAAAGVLLDRRVSHGAGSTGWSRTWLINTYARLYRGEDAWNELTEWFAVFPTPYNLYNTNQGPYLISSRSTATLASSAASLRCCFRVTLESYTCFQRCHLPYPLGPSLVFWRGAVLRWT